MIRSILVAVVAIAGLYWAGADFWAGKGLAATGAILISTLGLAWFVASFGLDHFEPPSLDTYKPLGLIVFLLATVAAVGHSPAANLCQQRAYVYLLQAAQNPNLFPPLTAAQASLAQKVFYACALQPTRDQAALTSQMMLAESDLEVSRTDLDSGFLRRAAGLDPGEPGNDCVAAYHDLAAERPDAFAGVRGELTCLDEELSRWRL